MRYLQVANRAAGDHERDLEMRVMVVAMKPANKVEQLAAEQSAAVPTAAESAEPRAGTKGNACQQTMPWAQSQTSMPHALERIRKVARERKKEKFISLCHRISIDLLEDAFYELKVDAAPGVEGLRSGPGAQSRRFAQPGPKRSVSGAAKPASVHTQARWPATPARGRGPGGQDRPTGGSRAAERDLRGGIPRISYGFRPGRGTHDALDALCVGIHSKKVSFILDADIRSFFDEINQEWLTRFLEHRIGDRRIIRLIQKWLKAGVMEGGVVTVSDRGTVTSATWPCVGLAAFLGAELKQILTESIRWALTDTGAKPPGQRAAKRLGPLER